MKMSGEEEATMETRMGTPLAGAERAESWPARVFFLAAYPPASRAIPSFLGDRGRSRSLPGRARLPLGAV
jgi:hypothetical protein